MNQKIKEFSDQAWEFAESYDYTDAEANGIEFSDILEQKFAELIIKQCIKIIEDNNRCPDGYVGSHDDGYSLGCQQSIERILSNFDIVKRSTTKCCICGDDAAFIRNTQFSGNHPYCEYHAKQQEDFNTADPSYFYWQPITNND